MCEQVFVPPQSRRLTHGALCHGVQEYRETLARSARDKVFGGLAEGFTLLHVAGFSLSRTQVVKTLKVGQRP